MNTLYLISCVAAKLQAPAEARELYVSPWFKKARRYVEQRQAPWRILSAKHGLVDPLTLVAPYDETLNAMSTPDRRRWAQRVFLDLRPLLSAGDTAVFLAGQRYRAGLISPLLDLGVTIEVPMSGLTIGRQLQWLDKANHE